MPVELLYGLGYLGLGLTFFMVIYMRGILPHGELESMNTKDKMILLLLWPVVFSAVCVNLLLDWKENRDERRSRILQNEQSD